MTPSATASAPPATEVWSRYWGSGILHSCACAFRGNYEGATARFWSEVFAGLDDASVVVDVGTGNGAIPLLARAAAGERGIAFDIHGVDLAAIDPPATAPSDPARYAGIRFHPRTSMTDLPWVTGAVDCLTGQYALEYAPRDAATAEVARVLAPGGRAAFVIHSRDSLILATTADQLASCRLLFEDSGFFEHAQALCGLLAAASTPEARRQLGANPKADAARRRFNRAAQRLSERVARAHTPDLLQVAMGAAGEALREAPGWGATRTAAFLARHEADLRDEWQRLRDLDAAALDGEGITALAQRFAELGLTRSQLGRIEHAPGRQLGWTLVVARG